jgi:hypothetical protein
MNVAFYRRNGGIKLPCLPLVSFKLLCTFPSEKGQEQPIVNIRACILAQDCHRQSSTNFADTCSTSDCFVCGIHNGELAQCCMPSPSRIWNPIHSAERHIQSDEWNLVHLDHGEGLELFEPVLCDIYGHELPDSRTQRPQLAHVNWSTRRSFHYGVQDGHGPSACIKSLTHI